MSIRDEDGTTSGSKGAQGPGPQARFDRRRRGVRVTYAAAIALGLAVGGGAVAGAATSSSPSSTTTPSSTHADGPGGGHRFGGTPPAAFGTVASVGANTFTLTAHDGTTVTVNVSGSTTYADPSVTTATFADVKVGDHVAVFGTDTSNTVAATKVAVGGPRGPGGPGGPGGQFGPGGSHGPDGAGGWSPPSSSSTSPSGAATNGSSTTSNVATTGYTLN